MEVEYDESGRDGLVVRLMLLELKPAHIVPLHLPLPKDPRILKMCRGILADLIDDSTIEVWGSRVGASGRTIIRQFQSETGLSFRQWKQQAR